MIVDIANGKLSLPTGESQLVIETSAPTVNKLSVLLETYSDIFVSGPNDPLDRTTRAEHPIDTGDSRPVKQRPYRIPVYLKKVVDRQVNDMLERGLNRPSNSSWSSPIVLAPKKDGDCRLCVDFRRVNSVTKKDAQPMPRIDDILDQLGGARYFSILDLASGFWQVPLREQDREKTPFSEGGDHYEFTVRDAGTRKGPGGQTLLKGTDKILNMLKSIPWNLEGQLHSSCAKFLPIIFLAWHLRSH